MALSRSAEKLLALLRRDGKASNASTLKRKLGVDDATFESAQEELMTAGLAQRSGGRLARTAVAPEGLSVEAEMLLSALPTDGSTAGNYSLRSKLDLDDATYKSAKRELLGTGRVRAGVGYGGTLARADAIPDKGSGSEPPRPGLVTREKDLCAPFAEWLSASLDDQDLAFAHAKITATGRGRARSSGPWSRPAVGTSGQPRRGAGGR
jgi:hypothetical protein